MTGMIALHGGGEYIGGDEDATDLLLDAALTVAGSATPRVVILPTAVARHRPEIAIANGRRAFEQAARRKGRLVDVGAVRLLRREDALTAPRELVDRLAGAHLIHLPGGDPDLIPAILPATPAWAAIRQALSAGACLAGASAGAMAMADRVWTPAGPLDGLGLLPGYAVLPHFSSQRLQAWRREIDGDRELRWIGIDEQSILIGRPGSSWRVGGRGSVRVFEAGTDVPAWQSQAGEPIELP